MNRFIIAAIATAVILPSAAMARPADQVRPADTHAVVVDHGRGPASHRPVEVKRIVVGSHLDPAFIARQNVIQHPARYHLAKTNAKARWIKVRNDAVMVNVHNGRVLNVAHNLFR